MVEVALARCLVMPVFAGKGAELGPVLRNRDLWLVNTAFIAVLATRHTAALRSA